MAKLEFVPNIKRSRRLICPICEKDTYAKYKGTSQLEADKELGRWSRKCQVGNHSAYYMFWLAEE